MMRLEEPTFQRYGKIILITIILICGILLRTVNLDKAAMIQDESETVLHTLSVMEKGLPINEYNNLPFINTPFVRKSSNETYEFVLSESTGSQYKSHTGWLPNYIQLPFFALLGVSTATARLPFAIIGVLTLILIYLMARELFNDKVAVISMFLLAFNPAQVIFDRSSRYYSLLRLCVLLSLYFLIKAIRTDRDLYYVLMSVSLVLLFHTHISATILTTIIIFLVLFTQKRRVFGPRYIIPIAVFCLFTLPWLLFVRFWHNLGLFQAAFPSITKSITYPFWMIGAEGSIYILFVIALLWLLNRLRLEIKDYKSSARFIFIVLTTGFIVTPFIVPSISHSPHVYIPLAPFMLILVAWFVTEVKWPWLCVGIVLLLLTFIHLSPVYPANYTLTKLGSVFTGRFDYGANWVWDVKDFLDAKGISKETWVFMSYNDLTLRIYGYKAQLVWPVRRSYLESLNETFYIVEEPGKLELHCNGFYQFVNPEQRCGNSKFYLGLNCSNIKLDSGINVYECSNI